MKVIIWIATLLMAFIHICMGDVEMASSYIAGSLVMAFIGFDDA